MHPTQDSFPLATSLVSVSRNFQNDIKAYLSFLILKDGDIPPNGNVILMFYSLAQGRQRGTRKDQVGRPRAYSKNNISIIINVFALTNINTEIIEGKLSKFFFQNCVSN